MLSDSLPHGDPLRTVSPSHHLQHVRHSMVRGRCQLDHQPQCALMKAGRVDALHMHGLKSAVLTCPRCLQERGSAAAQEWGDNCSFEAT